MYTAQESNTEVDLRRPDNLPDFATPPLVEVVLGVQFTAPAGYREVFAREVWALYEAEFPQIQEQPALEPRFEVFGGQAGDPSVQVRFGLVTGPIRNRYWFLASDETEIIQFQNDRFIHNWRKKGGKDEYPRFEPIVAKYRAELDALERYFLRKNWGLIAPNQCELTYVNHIPLVDESGTELPKSFYFRRLDVSLIGDANEFSASIRQIMLDGAKNPVGRLHVDAVTRNDVGGKPIIALTLTARGAPSAPDCPSAVRFLQDARLRIVHTFAAITSDAAHAKWGRTQ
jgi:uncharacterized protein (TIGR04255 family)